jgi:hypothetical protein
MLLLAAQVVWPDGKVASFADARLSQASDVMVDDDGFHRLQGPPEWAAVWHGETGVTGRFYVCDLPRRALLRLDVEHDGATARWEFTTSDRGRLVYANRLVLPPKKP